MVSCLGIGSSGGNTSSDEGIGVALLVVLNGMVLAYVKFASAHNALYELYPYDPPFESTVSGWYEYVV